MFTIYFHFIVKLKNWTSCTILHTLFIECKPAPALMKAIGLGNGCTGEAYEVQNHKGTDGRIYFLRWYQFLCNMYMFLIHLKTFIQINYFIGLSTFELIRKYTTSLFWNNYLLYCFLIYVTILITAASCQVQ